MPQSDLHNVISLNDTFFSMTVLQYLSSTFTFSAFSPATVNLISHKVNSILNVTIIGLDCNQFNE